MDCAKRLFSKPAFKEKTPDDREFLLKLAALRVLDQIPEGCVQDALEAIRRRSAGVPDKPVAYLTKVIKDWLEKHNQPTLGELLVAVDVPASLKKPKGTAA